VAPIIAAQGYRTVRVLQLAHRPMGNRPVTINVTELHTAGA
jgi:hypothetical protein